MAQTTIIDNGSELNLDELFDGLFTEDLPAYTLDGTPEGGNNNTFVLSTFSNLKLATNPRDYKGTTIHDFYSFGGWEKGSFHRTEYKGRLVEGPQAHLFELGTMVTATAQPQETAYLFDENTILTIRGTRYTVKFSTSPGRKNKYPELTPLTES